jgi:chemotaxis protein methyltransferase CheR
MNATPAAASGAIRPLTEAEFGRFRELVEVEVGIHLTSVKQALVNARLLSRIRELGLGTFQEYYERVIASPHDELIRFINAICTNETRFFREPAQFEYLRTTLVTRWRAEGDAHRRPRRVRVWSAACSSGEEPYTLAMTLLTCLPPDWSVEIVATDISTKVLDKAVAAVYSMERLKEIPSELHQRFLLRGTGSRDGVFRVGPTARAAVTFQRLNLVTGDFNELGRFDLILCRNVLMYFRPETRRDVVSRLLGQLSPAGQLFVGHSESLHGLDLGVDSIAPTIYRVRGAG